MIIIEKKINLKYWSQSEYTNKGVDLKQDNLDLYDF